MKRVEGTNTEFLCEKNEVATINIKEINTDFIVACSPQNDDIKMVGKIVTVKVGSSTKTVTLGFEFNDNSGGSYRMVLTGSKGGSFNRGVLQPSSSLPAIRNYTFHVS